MGSIELSFLVFSVSSACSHRPTQGNPDKLSNKMKFLEEIVLTLNACREKTKKMDEMPECTVAKTL